MIDFIISAIVSLFVNIEIVAPYLDPMRKVMIDSGMSEIQVDKVYYAISGASLLTVGMMVYIALALLKLISSRS